MKSPVAAFPLLDRMSAVVPLPVAARWAALAVAATVLAGCATQPAPSVGRAGGGRYFDPILGVWASPRLVEDGQPVPRGGGGYLVGRPYTIGGRTFVPNANPRGYVAVGTASWYGDAFHGRRTANGEIFDKGSISAAHPTLPLPSYVRVTNLKNGRSMIVRVNDRGPYHGGRVMDVSQRVAEALAFKNEGTGRIRIDYVGRAGLSGSDDDRLLATLTTDGRPARLDGMAEPVEVADAALPPPPDGPSPLPNIPARVAALPVFRTGHAVMLPVPVAASDPPAAPPVKPAWPAPARGTPLRAAPARPAAAPDPVPAAATRPRMPAAGHRAPAGGDPYFHPLFPAPKPAPRPAGAISFSDQPGRASPARPHAVRPGQGPDDDSR